VGRKAERRRDRKGSERAEDARRAMEWTRRRLDVLEVLVLFLAFLLALLGGALVAWVLSSVSGAPFRFTWAVSSLLLFIVPGGGVYLRELRRGKKGRAPHLKSEPKDPNG
jgi:hypothetical protein